ncbi:MAG: malto-oligosyltrehalose trehalohydrolase [Gemmatimonadota bacterium]|nr:malto-oligosyltrehalose trehalohydrolase [Gemmatimonadota bacterium]
MTSIESRVGARRLPVGAEVVGPETVHFRVWAPRRRTVRVVVESAAGKELRSVALDREAGGYFAGLVEDASEGMLYRYRLDQGDRFPDPASRFQPQGPHGPSMVVDPGKFRWTDEDWGGPTLPGAVIYEMHVGTFTPEGTWTAAERHLSALAELGITVIELMPVADFPGRFGWGYDGVDLFAPTRLYGSPDEFRHFTDRAHGEGLAVILDVVYNHVGPDGNYLAQFSPYYISERHRTEWGPAINFDGPQCEPVREFAIANAGYWIDEFHLDGLRLDATQSIFDDSKTHIIVEVCERARAAAGTRSTLIVGENEPQDVRLLRPPREGGYGLDAVWNDDWHHTAAVAVTGRHEAYYTDYRGTPQEFVSAAKYGFLYQGQHYSWQKQRRGTPTRGIDAARFVHFLQNHDQVANSASGARGHELAPPGRWRALTALLLLGPQTPMLFQGQEFGTSSPFLYFADHIPELAQKVREGRTKFLLQFPSIAQSEVRNRLADPSDPDTFERSKLDHEERERRLEMLALHRDLLRLRRDDPVLAAQATQGVDGAVLSTSAFALRFFAESDQDRLLLVNVGAALDFDPAPEPLLAPPVAMRWELRWSSEDPRYGGEGMPPIEDENNWHLPGESAVLLIAARASRR